MSDESWVLRWIPEIVLAGVAGLMSLVRAGDIERIANVEKKLLKLEQDHSSSIEIVRQNLDRYAHENRADVADLRSDMTARHDALMKFLLETKKN